MVKSRFWLLLALLLLVPMPRLAHGQDPRTPITAQTATQLSQEGTFGFGTASDVAYSPDGMVLAVASSTGIWLHNAQDPNGALPLLLTDVPRDPKVIAFDPTSSFLVTYAFDSTISAWRISDNTALWTQPSPAQVNDLTYSPDGTRVAIGDTTGALHVWDAATGEVVFQVASPLAGATVLSLAYAPDGQSIAVSRYSGGLSLYNAETGDVAELPIRMAQDDNANTITYSTDGTRLITQGRDVVVWNAATGDKLFTIPLPPALTNWATTCVNAGGRVALVGGGLQQPLFQAWDLVTFSLLAEVNDNATHNGCAISPDGTVATLVLQAGATWQYDVPRATRTAAVTGYYYNRYSPAFNPAGDRIFAASLASRAEVLDSTTGEVIWVIEQLGRISRGAFSPSGAALVTGGSTAELTVWDATTGESVRTIPAPAVADLAFSPDGTRLFTVSYLQAKSAIPTSVIYDFATGTALHTFTESLTEGYFTADGSGLVATVEGGGLGRWHTDTFALEWQVYDSIGPIALSPDGAFVAQYKRGDALIVRDATNGDTVATSTPDPTVSAERIAYSPDGSVIAVAYLSSIRLYDATSLEVLATLDSGPGNLNDIAFSADGTQLATVASDATLRVWRVAN